MEDVDIVVKALTGEGAWPKPKMTNGDVVRLHLACDVIKVNPRDSIYYAALKAYGDGVNTNMFVRSVHVLGCYSICFTCPGTMFTPALRRSSRK